MTTTGPLAGVKVIELGGMGAGAHAGMMLADLGADERLGIGPDECAALNPRLIFARITGWGQDGLLDDERESLPIDGGVPFYQCYETSDGKYMAVGALESQFFVELLKGLELSADEFPNQQDIASHGKIREIFAERFASKSRDEWTQIFGGSDACVTTVLTWSEAPSSAHLSARSTLINNNGVIQAAPAPRFSRTPAGPVGPLPAKTPLAEIDW